MRALRISVAEQRLTLLESGACVAEYAVSTAKNGVGEQDGSFRTPRGRHIIRARIGAGLPLNAVLKRRRPTGEIYTPELGALYPERDWILSRILWLSGRERGFNRGGECDTMRRYIYIHGCPDELPMGVPLSHGCIRLRNEPMLELFERVAVGDQVLIEA